MDALGNPSPVSLGDQRFKAYSYLVLATIFCAMTAFYLTGLALAVAAGTIFNSTNIAVIVASQMFCMTMTLFHFERGYKARRKLLNLSSELPGLPAINHRSQFAIAYSYFTLAIVSIVAVLFHWYQLGTSIGSGADYAWTNIATIVASNVVCLVLIDFQFVRGFREKPNTES